MNLGRGEWLEGEAIEVASAHFTKVNNTVIPVSFVFSDRNTN